MQPTDGSDLFMVRLALDAAEIARAGERHGLPRRSDDLGYAVHTILAGLFGKGTVQPFRIEKDTVRRVPILGYSRLSAEELEQHALEFADPGLHQACAWGRFASKRMPDGWALGRRLGYEVRVCPVVRLSSAVETTAPDGSPVRYSAGAEVDAWVHASFLADEAERLDRRVVYQQWLRERLGPAISELTVELQSFRRLRLVRRTQGSQRKSRLLERPDVLLTGELVVGNPTAFGESLAHGIGRHRAFGFGMLLLRSPRNES